MFTIVKHLAAGLELTIVVLTQENLHKALDKCLDVTYNVYIMALGFGVSPT